MKHFKELLEGTSATITVFDGKTYKTSYLQYDAGSAGKVLVNKYNNIKDASKLVQKSGELRGIDPIDYYTDRKILDVTKDIKQAISNSNEMYIKFFFDGESWYEYRGKIKEFEQMEII